MGEPFNILALDAATTTGFAYWAHGKWEWGALKGWSQPKRIDLAKMAMEAGVTHFAIEQPYLGRNAKTYGDLKELRGLWRADCQREGLLYIENDLRPSTWQRQMLVVSGAQCPRGMTKVWSCMVAGQITGCAFKAKEHDAADSVCIAQYVKDMVRLGGILEVMPV